jgi:hypothetical protein
MRWLRQQQQQQLAVLPEQVGASVCGACVCSTVCFSFYETNLVHKQEVKYAHRLTEAAASAVPP